jgi:hypothetical protein
METSNRVILAGGENEMTNCKLQMTNRPAANGERRPLAVGEFGLH